MQSQPNYIYNLSLMNEEVVHGIAHAHVHAPETCLSFDMSDEFLLVDVKRLLIVYNKYDICCKPRLNLDPGAPG